MFAVTVIQPDCKAVFGVNLQVMLRPVGCSFSRVWKYILPKNPYLSQIVPYL